MTRLTAILLLITLPGCASPEFWEGAARGVSKSNQTHPVVEEMRAQEFRRQAEAFQAQAARLHLE